MNNVPITDTISEGETEIFVFKKKYSKRGPGFKDKLPFYNPAMELNRDISILVNQWFVNNNNKSIQILDGLAASGIRGIRIANEVKGDFTVTINDWSREAYLLIKRNLNKYKFKNVIVSNKNLNSLLSERKYDYIDIDPFGSPTYYIDSSIRSINNNGIIACTATDTATLCGVYPKVCLRRYGVESFNSPVMHETAIRILLSFICREAVKYDKGIEPLMCYATDHYLRIYIKVRNGVKFANRSISNIKFVETKVLLSNHNKSNIVGPLWLAEIQDKNVIKELRTDFFKRKFKTRIILFNLLNLLEDESNANPFFYTTEFFSSLLKVSPPRIKYICDNLIENGYKAVRTHFNTTGFKTNASRDEILSIFKKTD